MLVRKGNAFYEIDEACMENKKRRQEKKEKNEKDRGEKIRKRSIHGSA